MAGESFIWGAQGKKMSPEEVARQRAVAALLSQEAIDTSPVGHWSQGAARLVNAFSGVRKERQASAAEEQGRSGAKSVIDALLGGGNVSMSSMGVSPSAPAGVAPVAEGGLGYSGQPPSAPMAQGGNKQAFIEAMMPHALAVSAQTGLDPRLVIAQSAQETGWGKSAPGNNYFGIKSHGKGGGNTLATNEVINGQTVRINDSFRGYGDMGESALGYASFLKENPRYRDMLSAPDLDSQVAALGRSGYATDPNYAASVGSIARSIPMPDGSVSMSTQGDPSGGGYAPPQPAPQGTSPVMQALLQASTDPWVAQEYGPVLQALMGQEQSRQQFAMEQSDPMRQLEMQKAQLEIEQMRNPTATLPASVQEIQWKAQALGLQPGSQEYNDFIMTGGSDGVPAEVQALQWRAQQAGLEPGTQEYQDFIMNGGARGTGVPAGFAALDAQAKAGGLEPGTPEYQQFMIGGGAGQRAAATATGKMQAEAQIALPSTIATAERALANIEAIRNDPALPGITGMVQGRIPPMSPAGTDLNVRINQAKGQTFLEAFESLKGAGQITEIEGQKAEQAIARLDRAQSTEAYQQALDDLADVLRSGMERARTKAGVQPPAPPMGGIMAAPPESAAVENVGPPVKRMRFDPVTGMFE